MFQREDWTLFRSLNTLGQKAGVPIDQIPALVAKELVDNALDACGGCQVGFLQGNGIWVHDEGEGIPGDDTEVASLFSIARHLTSSKILRKPGRGAMGNGLRVVAGAVLATKGQLVVSTRGRTLKLSPEESTGKTVPKRLGEWNSRGCRIAVDFGSIKVKPDTLHWANLAIRFASGESSYKGDSSPYWYDSESFYELLQASGTLTVRELVANLRGCTEPKAGRIANNFKGRHAKELSRSEADDLLRKAQSESKAVSAKSLGRIGQAARPASGYSRVLGRLPIQSGSSAIAGELPVSIEAWAELSKKPHVTLLINRTPVTGELYAGMDKTNLVLQGCGTYLEIPIGRKPVRLFINVDIPYMPITTDGKEPDLGRFGTLIAEVSAKAVRIARRKSSLTRGAQDTKKDAIVANLEVGVAQASGNGEYRFSQRQLFYAIRPLFIEAHGEAPGWNYFCQVVTAHEEKHGDIQGMYRDPRGVVYHPHLREDIPLGTLHVEKYVRPDWMFNKVLYCEKEGFFEIFKSVQWAERNDCALMTSKGFSSRAARDLIDHLADTDEECKFFCIHDSDAQGTMIYQTLQSATKARGDRKVEIINLGLDPAEARDMGLQVEPVEKGHTKAVADYISANDRLWLQTNRVELNAMTTPEFLDWLDRKFAPYAGKVIPPADVLGDQLRDDVRNELDQKIAAEILEEARHREKVDEAFVQRTEIIDAAVSNLPDDVQSVLTSNTSDRWVIPVGEIAREIARRPAG